MIDTYEEIMLKSCSELLTIREVQDLLRIGRTKAYHLVSSNQIRALQIGKQKRIPKAEVLDYIRRGIDKVS